jgi:hypothetical protein
MLLDFIILILLGDEYKSRNSSLCSFLHSPATSPPFGSKYPPQHPVVKKPPSLNVRDQLSHPYRTKGKIIVLCILIFKFSTATEKTEGSGANGNKHYHNSVGTPFYLQPVRGAENLTVICEPIAKTMLDPRRLSTL